jgi:hypothetical protein
MKDQQKLIFITDTKNMEKYAPPDAAWFACGGTPAL